MFLICPDFPSCRCSSPNFFSRCVPGFVSSSDQGSGSAGNNGKSRGNGFIVPLATLDRSAQLAALGHNLDDVLVG